MRAETLGKERLLENVVLDLLINMALSWQGGEKW